MNAVNGLVLYPSDNKVTQYTNHQQIFQMISQQEFLKKYNHSRDAFAATELKWSDLMKVASDYEDYKKRIDPIGRYLVERFIVVNKVHSVRYRVKDTEHLIDKIIRKKLEDPSRVINLQNYKQEVTDLVGLRILHLFKEDWEQIHQFIPSQFNLNEAPTAYYRQGDSKDYISRFEEHGCTVKEHKFGYRSVHYLIKSSPTKEEVIAEIQVRTIFEEAWSEIDHVVRYPNISSNSILEQFLQIFNRLSGSSDEMGSFVISLKSEMEKRSKEFEERINALKSEAKKGKPAQIIEGLDSLKRSYEISMEPMVSWLKEHQSTVNNEIIKKSFYFGNNQIPPLPPDLPAIFSNDNK